MDGKKIVDHCLKEHYINRHKVMTLIDSKVRRTYNLILERHKTKGGISKEALLIMATIDKIGLDTIVKAKVK